MTKNNQYQHIKRINKKVELEKGLSEIKLNAALNFFSKGKVSTSEAAEI